MAIRLPERKDSSVARFPEFFRDHSVLPPGVAEPTDRTPWEEALLRKLSAAGPSEDGLVGGFWVAEPDEIDAYIAVTADDPDAAPRDDAGAGGIDGFAPEDAEDTDADSVPKGADAIARYLPWHLHGDDWGIYFDGRAFWRHVREIEVELTRQGAALPRAEIAAGTFAQILAHEHAHFAGEILGTQLESTAGRSGYRDYVLTRYSFRNSWTIGAPEEIIATHAEVNAAAPGALKDAAKAIASRSPSGYSDWALARDDRQRRLIETSVAAQMVVAAGFGGPWPSPGKRERDAVPLHWRPGGLQLPAFLRRAPARITPRSVQKYLRSQGFLPDPRHTRGHHYWYERDGLVAAFSVQGGEIPAKEHSPLARSLGFASPVELRRALEAKSPPPALASV